MLSVSNLDEVKTGISIPRYFQVLGHVAVPRLSDAILLLLFYFHGLKVRGYSPSASRLVRRLVLCVMFDGWADLICALFNVWLLAVGC